MDFSSQWTKERMDEAIRSAGAIGHPHWYKPPKENTPSFYAEDSCISGAKYRITQRLNKLAESDAQKEKRQQIIDPLPEWVTQYAPPKADRVGDEFMLSRSQLAEALLMLHGENFRFNRFNERGVYEDRRYLLLIYNMLWPKIFFMCGRQVEKSQTLANLMALYSVTVPFYKSLYVSPSIIQTSTFSSEKLTPLLTQSPLIRDFFINNKCRQQVTDKSLTNGAFMFLRSAYYSADRARGISAYMLLGDEVQDQLPSNLEVISECLSHAAFPRWVYACTPKSLDNTASGYWEKSRKGEWFVPCLRHGTPRDRASWYWQPLGMENILEHGLSCRKCKKIIDPRLGEWRWTGDPKAEWAGFRISQLMAPWIPWNLQNDNGSAGPQSIISKMREYSKVRFMNEVLGLPFDDAEKPITQEELRRCCDPKLRNTRENLKRFSSGRTLIFRGGDWGTKTKKSYTVICDTVFVDGKWTIVHAKRYEGAEQDYAVCLPEIQSDYFKYKIGPSGYDKGIGFAQNDLLTFHVHGTSTPHMSERKIFPIQYVGNQGEMMRWNPEQDAYTLNRTKSLNRLFQMIKRGEIVFPCWEDMYDPFFKDILHIHQELRTSLGAGDKMMYNVNPELTDDFAHALNFSIQIGRHYMGYENDL